MVQQCKQIFTLRGRVMMTGLAMVLGCTDDNSAEQRTGETLAALTVADCPAGSNIIEGTAADDVLVGTSGSDCILGYDGNDVINGQQGDDLLVGGAGDDTLIGGSGDDVMDGGDGQDTLSADAGHDELWGGAGNDTLDGGNGVDTLHGGEGSDVMSGGNGGDTLTGGPGNDVILGGRGADGVQGGEGNDVIIGGNGPDQVDGGDGFDSCESGCEAGEPTGAGCGVDADCAPDQRCLVAAGLCIYCLGDQACDDGDPCTLNECNILSGCVSMPLDDCSAEATRLAFTASPASSVRGVPFNRVVVVTTDESGTIVTTDGIEVTLTIGVNPGGATVLGDATATTAAGTATFDVLGLDQVGSGYTLVASATGLAAATSSSFDIQPPVFEKVDLGVYGGSVANVAISSGSPSILYAGTPTGVYRSDDDGSSWALANFGNPGGAGLVFVDPADPRPCTRLMVPAAGAMVAAASSSLARAKTGAAPGVPSDNR